MPFIPRIGRPGLLGLAARTAVVAGTATAVSGAVAAHRQNRAQTQYEAAQYEAAQSEAAQFQALALRDTLPQRAVVAEELPPASASADLVDQLENLGRLRSQGMLTDAEFAAAKARLLS